MTAADLAGRVLAALDTGDPMPEHVDGLEVAWVFDIAPGDNDGIDTLHYAVEVWELDGEALAGFYRASAGERVPLDLRTLTAAQLAAVIDRWEELFAWPYNNEFEGIAT